jgi:hypothetical protein
MEQIGDVFKLGKSGTVPELQRKEALPISFFDGWDCKYDGFLYVSIILLYAVSLEGSLAYD